MEFDKTRIQKLNEINRLIKIVDISLRENVGGFLTYYTQKIKSLSKISSEREIKDIIKKTEEEKVIKKIKDREQQMFWDSLEYYIKTDSNFKEKANKIINKLIINKKDALRSKNDG